MNSQMEKHHHRTEFHFLPIPPPPPPPDHLLPPRPPSFDHHHHMPSFDHHVPSLDLQLSISLNPFKPPPPPKQPTLGRRIELLRWQAAEQMRLAAMEKAYANRVRELTRREMELAQSEQARARILWDKTMEDLTRVDRMKENSMVRIISPFPHQVSSSSNRNACMEITCHSCRRRFRPIN